jgi:serine/threonine protein kinase
MSIPGRHATLIPVHRRVRPCESETAMSTRQPTLDDGHPTVGAHQAGAPATEPTGRLVADRYRLRALLGRGGMGRVWLADDEVLHRSIALKQILLNGVRTPTTRAEAWDCACREARAAAQVDHPGAVGIYDVIEDDQCPWIVMEPLSGRTLRERLNAEGPLPVDEVTRVGLCLLDVLQATHDAGVVHLDVKPSNVHLCDDARVVLTDFGIACGVDDVPFPGVFAGSPAYVAPERVDSGEFGPASDLYSLGATLFAAVEGRPPFDRGSAHATFTAVVTDAPAPFEHAGKLRPVIEGLLAKDPGRRLDADQARAALRAA